MRLTTLQPLSFLPFQCEILMQVISNDAKSRNKLKCKCKAPYNSASILPRCSDYCYMRNKEWMISYLGPRGFSNMEKNIPSALPRYQFLIRARIAILFPGSFSFVRVIYPSDCIRCALKSSQLFQFYGVLFPRFKLRDPLHTGAQRGELQSKQQ